MTERAPPFGRIKIKIDTRQSPRRDVHNACRDQPTVGSAVLQFKRVCDGLIQEVLQVLPNRLCCRGRVPVPRRDVFSIKVSTFHRENRPAGRQLQIRVETTHPTRRLPRHKFFHQHPQLPALPASSANRLVNHRTGPAEVHVHQLPVLGARDARGIPHAQLGPAARQVGARVLLHHRQRQRKRRL